MLKKHPSYRIIGFHEVYLEQNPSFFFRFNHETKLFADKAIYDLPIMSNASLGHTSYKSNHTLDLVS